MLVEGGGMAESLCAHVVLGMPQKPPPPSQQESPPHLTALIVTFVSLEGLR